MTDESRGFAGFAAGKQPTTPLPSAFFSELLPLVDNLAELKVTLHLFWAISRKQSKGALRYVRLDELLADERLLEGLATSTKSGASVLRDGLERGVGRGSLLHATIHRGETTEEWYMVNSDNGRTVIAKLRSGELNLLADVAEDVQLQVERPNIFVLYEQNIGLLTPIIADELRDAERQYPAEWITEAFHEAVAMNKRTWRYINSILQRWQKSGRDAGRARPEVPKDPQERRRHNVPEGYEDLIEH
jgi:DNA replication protein